MKYLKSFNENNNIHSCPKCNAANRIGSKWCTACGFNLIDGKLCKKCKSILKPNSKFCTECGEKNAESSEGEKIDGKLCKKCKSILKPNSKFCTECGEKTENQVTAKTNNSSEKEKSVSKSFEDLCDEYSKMKGANLSALSVIKNDAKKIKEDFVKLAMINRLIDNLN
jgi:RNA polymerase subunit RPABC4/transcription elongation factor Spt4